MKACCNEVAYTVPMPTNTIVIVHALVADDLNGPWVVLDSATIALTNPPYSTYFKLGITRTNF